MPTMIADQISTTIQSYPLPPTVRWVEYLKYPKEAKKLGINGFIQESLATKGEIVAMSFGPYPAIFVSHPDDLRKVFVEGIDNYVKDGALVETLRLLAGNGLFLSEGDFWRSQRRIIQPEFTKKGVRELVADMTTVAASVSTEWDMQRRRGQEVDAGESMRQAAMRVICQSVLDTDVGKDAHDLGRALDRLLDIFAVMFSVPKFMGGAVDFLTETKRDEYIGQIDLFIESVIDQAKQQGTEGIIKRLLESPDPETGRNMKIEHLRDEIITLFIAGHETTANTMTWAWYSLCKHPEAKRKLQAEVDSVLGGRLPTADDLPHLVFTRAIIDETLRLYPPLPFVARQSVNDDILGGCLVPAKSLIVTSFFTMHRRKDFWENPLSFSPERFLPQNSGKINKHAYMPFGAGPRTCLGNHFAIAEAQILLATLAQRFDFALVRDREIGPAKFPGSLRPSTPVKLKLSARHAN